MPTSFSVCYDDLQPVAGHVRLGVVPLLVGEPAGHVVIRGLDSLHHGLIEHLNLGVALNDVAPPLVGQLDPPPVGILSCGADRHDDPFLPVATPVSFSSE